MEDKYVVIKESDLEWLRYKASKTAYSAYSKERIENMKSIPAQKLWDAAQKISSYPPIYNNGHKDILVKDRVSMNDFLTEQFDK